MTKFDESFVSGSTGKPKGVVHTIDGYMLTTALTTMTAIYYCFTISQRMND